MEAHRSSDLHKPLGLGHSMASGWANLESLPIFIGLFFDSPMYCPLKPQTFQEAGSQ